VHKRLVDLYFAAVVTNAHAVNADVIVPFQQVRGVHRLPVMQIKKAEDDGKVHFYLPLLLSLYLGSASMGPL
jgi:hypothetical protein